MRRHSCIARVFQLYRARTTSVYGATLGAPSYTRARGRRHSPSEKAIRADCHQLSRPKGPSRGAGLGRRGHRAYPVRGDDFIPASLAPASSRAATAPRVKTLEVVRVKYSRISRRTRIELHLSVQLTTLAHRVYPRVVDCGNFDKTSFAWFGLWGARHEREGEGRQVGARLAAFETGAGGGCSGARNDRVRASGPSSLQRRARCSVSAGTRLVGACVGDSSTASAVAPAGGLR